MKKLTTLKNISILALLVLATSCAENSPSASLSSPKTSPQAKHAEANENGDVIFDFGPINSKKWEDPELEALEQSIRAKRAKKARKQLATLGEDEKISFSKKAKVTFRKDGRKEVSIEVHYKGNVIPALFISPEEPQEEFLLTQISGFNAKVITLQGLCLDGAIRCRDFVLQAAYYAGASKYTQQYDNKDLDFILSEINKEDTESEPVEKENKDENYVELSPEELEELYIKTEDSKSDDIGISIDQSGDRTAPTVQSSSPKEPQHLNDHSQELDLTVDTKTSEPPTEMTSPELNLLDNPGSLPRDPRDPVGTKNIPQIKSENSESDLGLSINTSPSDQAAALPYPNLEKPEPAPLESSIVDSLIISDVKNNEENDENEAEQEIGLATSTEKEKKDADDVEVEHSTPEQKTSSKYAPETSVLPPLRGDRFKERDERHSPETYVGGGNIKFSYIKHKLDKNVTSEYSIDTAEFYSIGNEDYKIGDNNRLREIVSVQYSQSKRYGNNGYLINSSKLKKNLRGVKIHEGKNKYFQHGSGLTMNFIEYVGVNFKNRYPESPVCIHDISRKKGEQIGGHKSHKNGLDIDIAYPSNPNKCTGGYSFVNWDTLKPNDKNFMKRNWDFLKLVLSTDMVQVIFTVKPFMNKLCTYAKEINAPEKERAAIFKKLYHDKYHRNHYHVRLRCTGSTNKGCKPMLKPSYSHNIVKCN